MKKKVKRAKKDFQWCGVRFINGDNLATVYTYKVRAGVKLHLGQELVVRNHRGVSIVVVVAIGVEPGEFLWNVNTDAPRRAEDMNWKWLREKVAPL